MHDNNNESVSSAYLIKHYRNSKQRIHKMKNKCLVLLTIVSLTIVGCRTMNDKPTVVLFDNDVHCGIEGYAKMAALRDFVSDTAYTCLVSDGDFLQGGPAGALSKGQHVIDIMNQMHFTAVTLGNHEFDYKTPRMLELFSEFNAPVLCVNLIDVATGKRLYAESAIRKVGKKKIGFVGVTTPTSLYTEEYAFFDEDGKKLYDLCEATTYELVQKAVNKIRKKVDYVVVISHLGEDPNETNVDSHGLIQATTGIDALLDGHTHSVIPQETVMNKEGKPVLIAQTGTKFANAGKLVIGRDGRMWTELVNLKKYPYRDQRVRITTDSVINVLNAQTSRVICQSDVELKILDAEEKQQVRYAETNSGDLVADAYRIVTGAEFAMTNGGGLRVDLPKGQLTYGDLVTLLPFDNSVCVVDITGAQLKDLLETCTKHTPIEFGDFPQVSGIKFTIDKQRPVDDRITDLVILNKSGAYEPVQMDRTYSMATIDYCVTGGGFVGKLKQNKITKPAIILYNECLIKYVTEHMKGHIGSEYAAPQGRIIIKE